MTRFTIVLGTSLLGLGAFLYTRGDRSNRIKEPLRPITYTRLGQTVSVTANPTSETALNKSKFVVQTVPLGTPSQREDLIARNLIVIEARNGSLFRRLNLNTVKMESLKILMAAQQADLTLALFSRPVVQNAAFAREIEGSSRATENQILGLLGSDYDHYRECFRSMAYQDTITDITSILESSGVSLTIQEQDDALDAYSKAIGAAAKASAEDSAPLSTDNNESTKKLQLDRFDALLAAELSRVLDQSLLHPFMEAEYKQESIYHSQ